MQKPSFLEGYERRWNSTRKPPTVPRRPPYGSNRQPEPVNNEIIPVENSGTEFNPSRNMNRPVYGPPPVRKIAVCGRCGYKNPVRIRSKYVTCINCRNNILLDPDYKDYDDDDDEYF